MRLLPLAAPLLLLVAPLAALAESATSPGVESLRTEIGKYGWRVLEGADSVEVYRIESDPAPAGTADTVAGYRVTTRGKDQGKEFTARLRQALLEGVTVPGEAEKECKFQPGVAFRFVNGKDRLDLLLCFACNDLLLRATDPVAPDAREAMRPFDGWRAALVALAQEALPEDRVIAGLPPWKWEPEKAIAGKTGDRVVLALRTGTKVEVFRIKPDQGKPEAAELQVEGYPVISRGEDLGPAFANRIAATLLAGRTTLGPPKACEFRPGVAFRVTGPEGTATLLVCFSCDDIRTVAAPPGGAAEPSAFVSMDRGHDAWLELAKQALHADADIQGLKPAGK